MSPWRPRKPHLVVVVAVALWSLALSATGNAQNGTLDPTFGDGGRLVLDLPYGGSDSDQARDLLVQPDGKIVVVGVTDGYGVIGAGVGDAFAVARLLPDGTPDPSFSGDGFTYVWFGPLVTTDDRGDRVALLPDGSLVVGGRTERLGLDSGFGLAKLTPAGALDTTFGELGKVYVELPNSSYGVTGLAVTPQGKIVVAAAFYCCWVRLYQFLPDGTLDGTFGTGGYATLGSIYHDGSVAILDDGRIAALGWRSQSNWSRCVVQFYLPDGSLEQEQEHDTPFWSNRCRAVALGPGATIYAAGDSSQEGYPGPYEMSLHKASYDFGLVGEPTLKATVNFVFGDQEQATDLAVLPDQGLLLVGTVDRSVFLGGGRAFGVAKLTKSFELDPTFGTFGQVEVAFNQGATDTGAEAIALQPDGRIVIAGYEEVEPGVYDFALVRLLSAPVFADGFETGDLSMWSASLP